MGGDPGRSNYRIATGMSASRPQNRVPLSELPANEAELVSEARGVLARAYSPYSNVRVGAALRTAAGVFVGCNVENASFGLTLCAERTAVVKAVSAGEQVFEVMAIATSLEAVLMPCGACRQVLAEFAPELPLLVVGRETDYAIRTSLAELLPGAFLPDDLRP